MTLASSQPTDSRYASNRTIVEIAGDDRLESKPFTDLEQSEADVEKLSYVLRRLNYILTSAVEAAEFISAELQEGNLLHRVKIFNPNRLRLQQELNFVGFWGKRRADVSHEVSAAVERIDGQLVASLWQHPAILSYSSLQLSESTWINLVLLREASGKAHFHNSPLHQHVSQQLSPRYHDTVRLHNGTLSGGLKGRLQLESTKYYDFSEREPWYAIRSVENYCKCFEPLTEQSSFVHQAALES
jgi:hypothetical protein